MPTEPRDPHRPARIPVQMTDP
ncbi:hypothetical protein MICRO80W_480007 [Micrococcus luteus]|nr:hypothetical protein MICRO80W_480007 [Micrococcus luteus]